MGHKNMKKIYIIFMISLTLFGCSANQMPVQQISQTNTVSPAAPVKNAESVCEDVLNAINNRDKAALFDMFSGYSKSAYDIDTEIDRFFDSFSGKIVSVDPKYKDRINNDMSWENGQMINYWIEPCISGIITDTNKQYELHFCFRVVYKDDISREGLMYLSLYEPNNPDALAKIGGLD